MHLDGTIVCSEFELINLISMILLTKAQITINFDMILKTTEGGINKNDF